MECRSGNEDVRNAYLGLRLYPKEEDLQMNKSTRMLTFAQFSLFSRCPEVEYVLQKSPSETYCDEWSSRLFASTYPAREKNAAVDPGPSNSISA